MSASRRYTQTIILFIRDSLGKKPLTASMAAVLGVLGVVFQFLAIGLVAGFVMYYESGKSIDLHFFVLDPRQPGTIGLVGLVFGTVFLLQAVCMLFSNLLTVRLACDYQDKVAISLLALLDGRNDFTSLRGMASQARMNVETFLFRLMVASSAGANRAIRILIGMFPQLLTMIGGGVILIYLMPVLTALVSITAMLFVGVQKALSIRAANWNRRLDETQPKAAAVLKYELSHRLPYGGQVGLDEDSFGDHEDLVSSSRARKGNLEVLYFSQFFGTIAFILSMLVVLVYFGFFNEGDTAAWSHIVLYVMILVRVFMALRSVQMGMTNFNRFYRKLAQIVTAKEKLHTTQRDLRGSLRDGAAASSLPRIVFIGGLPITVGIVEQLARLVGGAEGGGYLFLAQSLPLPESSLLVDVIPRNHRRSPSRGTSERLVLERLGPGVAQAWRSIYESDLQTLGWSAMTMAQKADLYLLVALSTQKIPIIVDGATARRWFSSRPSRSLLDASDLSSRLVVVLDSDVSLPLDDEEVIAYALEEDGVTLRRTFLSELGRKKLETFNEEGVAYLTDELGAGLE